MTSAPHQNVSSLAPARRVYMVLSPRSLSYATLALRTLLLNCDELMDVHLITDSQQDKRALTAAIASIDHRHRCTVVSEDDLDDAEASIFPRYPHLRAFRNGHPCWRKITDPLLLSPPGEELVLLDPDLYFPNRFRFEATPNRGLLLMWQKPNCLLPPSVVRTAMNARVPLANHVDIGVSHWRPSKDYAELEWLNWLIGKLGGASLPRVMHVEAIVWSAIAMNLGGGGYLDPKSWVCWHRTQSKRIQRKLGASGIRILSSEPWSRMKCFHAGGEAKWWLTDAEASGTIQGGSPQVEPSRILPFIELTPGEYRREQTAKRIISGLGYHRVFGAGQS